MEILTLEQKLILAALSSLILPLLLHVFKKWYDEDAFHFKKYIDASNSINDHLTNLLDNTSAQRVALMQFHNGGKFYSGRPCQKLSMTHEKAFKARSLMSVFQNLPVSYLDFITKDLYYKDIVRVPDIEVLEGSLTKRVLLTGGTKSFYAYPICRKTFSFWKMRKVKRMLGFVTIQFDRKQELSETTLTDIELRYILKIKTLIK